MANSVYGRVVVVAALGMVAAAPALAASDVSNTPTLSNKAIGSVAASIASSQASTIVSTAATGGFTAGTGGFNAGGAGGFSTGGSGGFSPGGTGGSGGFSPGGTGGSGGFSPGGSGGTGGTGGSGGFNPGGEGGGATAPAGKPTSFDYRYDGKASGSADARNAFWGQALVGNVNKTESFMQMRGNIYNAMVGIDRRYNDRYTVGLAAGYEYVDMKTIFNQGTYTSQGATVAPYFAVNLTPTWVFDISAGYTWLNYTSDRQNDAVRGSFDGGRSFASSDISGGYAYRDFRFQPKLSILFTHEQQNSYTDSSGAMVGRNYFELGRFSGGGKAGYAFGNVLPYVKTMGEWDFRHAAAVVKSNGQLSELDTAGGVAGLGVEATVGGSTGSLEADYGSLGRQNLDVWMLIGRFHYAF